MLLNKRYTDPSQFSYLKQLLDLSSTYEKIALDFNKKIDYAIILYGSHSIGKTAAAHLLCGNPLKAQTFQGENIIVTTTSKNSHAKISNQGKIQTKIPNIFQINFKNPQNVYKKTLLIDSPGYHFQTNIFQTLTNSYYHYQTYSKVQNMKFVLCFYKNDNPEKIIDTLKEFTLNFRDYSSIKQQIWKSCAFLITKTEEYQNSLQDLQAKFIRLIQRREAQYPQNQTNLRSFIKYIFKEKRIFFIKKFKQGETVQCKGLIQKIDQKICDWWYRPYNQQTNQIDLSKLQFALAKRILLQQIRQNRCKIQLIQIMQFYIYRTRQLFAYNSKENIYSLGNVFTQLTNNVMKQSDPDNYLKIMKNYIDIYYNIYSPDYQQKRQTKFKQLFALKVKQEKLQQIKFKQKVQINQNQQKNKINIKENHIVSRFQALDKILCLRQQIQKSSSWSIRENAKITNFYSSKIQLIFSQIVNKFQNSHQQASQQSIKIKQKYGYLIYQFLEEAKFYILMLEDYVAQELKSKLKDSFRAKGFISLNRHLQDFMGIGICYDNENIYSMKELSIKYVQNFDIQKLNKQKDLDESLIQFFCNVDTDKDQIIYKKIKLILKYSNKLLKQFVFKKQINYQMGRQSIKRLLKRLLFSRKKCQSLFQQSYQDGQKQTEYNLTLIQITINLAKLLEYSKKFYLARKVYETIHFVDSCCRMFGQQLKINPNDNQLQIQFTQYLTKHYRLCKHLQQNYQTLQSIQQLQQANQKIANQIMQMRSQVTEYDTFLYSQSYFVNFKQDLEDQILTVQFQCNPEDEIIKQKQIKNFCQEEILIQLRQQNTKFWALLEEKQLQNQKIFQQLQHKQQQLSSIKEQINVQQNYYKQLIINKQIQFEQLKTDFIKCTSENLQLKQKLQKTEHQVRVLQYSKKQLEDLNNSIKKQKQQLLKLLLGNEKQVKLQLKQREQLLIFLQQKQSKINSLTNEIKQFDNLKFNDKHKIQQSYVKSDIDAQKKKDILEKDQLIQRLTDQISKLQREIQKRQFQYKQFKRENQHLIQQRQRLKDQGLKLIKQVQRSKQMNQTLVRIMDQLSISKKQAQSKNQKIKINQNQQSRDILKFIEKYIVEWIQQIHLRNISFEQKMKQTPNQVKRIDLLLDKMNLKILQQNKQNDPIIKLLIQLKTQIIRFEKNVIKTLSNNKLQDNINNDL